MEQKIKQDLSIGSTIRQMRIDAGLTQEAVTAKLQILGCNVSRSAYSQIEGGTYSIRISELAALKEIFSISFEDFFRDIK